MCIEGKGKGLRGELCSRTRNCEDPDSDVCGQQAFIRCVLACHSFDSKQERDEEYLGRMLGIILSHLIQRGEREIR